MRQYPPRAVFYTTHQYPLRAVFVPHVDIPCTSYSMCCTIPNFSTPHRAPILCAHHSLNCRVTTYAHIVRATTKILCALPTLHTPRTSLLYVCTPRNAKFIMWSCTPTFFHAVPKFSTDTRTLTFFHAPPKFSTHTSTPISCRAVSNFTYHKLFTAHHAFLVCPLVNIHFYAHQFLMNYAAEIGAFGLTFSPIYHRHSATTKFVQFHPDNTSSTYATTNCCKLTFLEQIYPKINSRIGNFNH
jgi:hypothetical protein